MAQRKKTQVSKNTITPHAQRPTYVLPVVLGAAVLAIGLYRAIGLSWVSDDAFITFRYIQHFTDGQGIVYNAGEYVEGYTHFLWLLILSAAKWLGADPVKASVSLGIVFFALTLILFFIIAAKEQLHGRARTLVSYLPVSALLLALNRDMNIWATGGLETSLYVFLISFAFFVWFYTSLSEQMKAILVGVLFLLLALTRPDGILFVVVGCVLFAAQQLKARRSLSATLKILGLLLLPLIVIGIPYLFWKVHYYGDIFPTTYYAKSADQSYFAQGFFYIFLFFRIYFSLIIASAALAILAIRQAMRKRPDGSGKAERPSGSHNPGSPIVAAAIAIIVYLVAYVAQVGGDFMFARFIIPVLPLLYFLTERLIDRLPAPLGRYRPVAALVFIGLVFAESAARNTVLFHTDAATGELAANWDDATGGATRGIADEHWVYTRPRFVYNDVAMNSIDVYCDIGKFYEPFFRGLPVSVVIIGAQNSIAYYANFQTCINDYGLTDAYIAHLPLDKRGRIGHEKRGTDEYYRKRGVHFQLFAVTGKLPEYPMYDLAIFPTQQNGVYQLAKIVTYDSAIVNELYRRFEARGLRVLLPKFDVLIPDYIKNVMPNTPVFQVEDDYRAFRRLYFDKYPNPELERQITAYIELHRKRPALLQ